MKQILQGLILALILIAEASAQSAWQPDLGNGTYQNPVLYADYSDPDLIRVGDDFWMTASSFNCAPGLPILHSTDLVNWQLVNHALPIQEPREHFDRPAHGDGVWAPAIRYHEGWFYIYWGDPDHGIYMVKSRDPRGEWSKPHLVMAAKGIIDTCPLWDEDGRAYLVHGWAGSRAGFKSILSVVELSPDGERIIGHEVMVFDGHRDHPTVEGPKFYKRNGWYYIFAPAGGVKPGWQIVLRSRSPYGPYECRKVLHQGNTSTPGPHQGGWVEDLAGDAWFMHFVDMYAYGRVVHLQPMEWLPDDWCRIGIDQNADGVGEPVERYRKPAGRSERHTPAASDEFSGLEIGRQWQWHANPGWGWAFPNPTSGELRLYCQHHPAGTLWEAGNLLLQKIDAPTYTATARLTFYPSYEGDRAGLMIMGRDYATLGFELREGRVWLSRTTNLGADNGGKEELQGEVEIGRFSSRQPFEALLRCEIRHESNADATPRMVCRLLYSLDGKRFLPLGEEFTAREGKWIGAKIGFYATAAIKKNDGGWVDLDWFRVE